MSTFLVVIVGGTVAGLAATWLMTQVTTFMYEREDGAAREREDRARGDMSAYEVMVPLLRLTPGPMAFPWQTHFRGLVGHLAFGATAEVVIALIALAVPG